MCVHVRIHVIKHTITSSILLTTQELFQLKTLPQLEGELAIREGKKSSWKKHTFVLRASGLYYSKSGKSLASKDIMRVVEWKDVDCFTGTQYKKFYRAPGNFCFSLVVSVCVCACMWGESRYIGLVPLPRPSPLTFTQPSCPLPNHLTPPSSPLPNH